MEEWHATLRKLPFDVFARALGTTSRASRAGRAERSSPDHALRQIWEAAGYPWSVRLQGLLPIWLPWAAHDHGTVRFLWLAGDRFGQRVGVHRPPSPHYCATHAIEFTRGRPYKKDDNAHIEQKKRRRCLDEIRVRLGAGLDALKRRARRIVQAADPRADPTFLDQLHRG